LVVHQNHQQSVAIPPVANQWDQMPQQHQEIYAIPPPNEMLNQTVQQPMPSQTSEPMNGGGEYANYAVNEQYSNKFEQVQAPSIVNPLPYDSWVSFFAAVKTFN